MLRAGRGFAVRLPRARYLVYEEAGQMLPYEVAEEFNRALFEFLPGR